MPRRITLASATAAWQKDSAPCAVHLELPAQRAIATLVLRDLLTHLTRHTALAVFAFIPSAQAPRDRAPFDPMHADSNLHSNLI